jgi:hypothetical protein
MLHKQLALKYSMPRFKNVHQGYLRELMKPRLVVMPGGRWWYQQEHKIVEGQFLVLETTVMYFEGSLWDYMILHGTGLCHHVRVETVDWARTPLEGTFTEPRTSLLVKLVPTDEELRAPGKRDSDGLYWCYYCMSDFSIDRQDYHLKIRCWHDFGKQVPPIGVLGPCPVARARNGRENSRTGVS